MLFRSHGNRKLNLRAVCRSVGPVSLSVCLSVCLPCQADFLPAYLSARLVVRVAVWLVFCLPGCPCGCLTVRLVFCLPGCPCVCLTDRKRAVWGRGVDVGGGLGEGGCGVVWGSLVVVSVCGGFWCGWGGGGGVCEVVGERCLLLIGGGGGVCVCV